MVDTTLSPAAAIEPPFADPPQDQSGNGAFSQPWNAYFTHTSDRVATLTSDVSLLFDDVTSNTNRIITLEGEVVDLQTQMAGLVDVADRVTALETLTATLSSDVSLLFNDTASNTNRIITLEGEVASILQRLTNAGIP